MFQSLADEDVDFFFPSFLLQLPCVFQLAVRKRGNCEWPPRLLPLRRLRLVAAKYLYSTDQTGNHGTGRSAVVKEYVPRLNFVTHVDAGYLFIRSTEARRHSAPRHSDYGRSN